MDTKRKAALITGSSSGMGFATALIFARNGYVTYASVRDTDSGKMQELREISSKEKLDIHVLHLDLTNHVSIENAVNDIVSKHGCVDVLINNAAYGYLSAVEDIDIHTFKKQFDTNVVGTLKLIQKVIPHMRKQKNGLIVNISSVMGFSTAPLNAPYSVSKFALESISETLAVEVKPFGINVVVLQPGSFHTKFLENAVRQDYSEDSPYYKLYKRMDAKKDVEAKDPTIVADLIFNISKMKEPALRYTVGKDALIRKLIHTILPGKFWIKFLRFFYKW